MSRYISNSCRIYVGDLPKDISEKELERYFREFGELKSVWVARNPPGFAFLEYEDERDASDAVKSMDGSEIGDMRIRVKLASDKAPRNRGQTSRRAFDPQDRCYRCNERGHYAYDCDKYKQDSKNRRSRSDSRRHMRSRSRSIPRRERSFSRSPIRRRRRSYSRSRS